MKNKNKILIQITILAVIIVLYSPFIHRLSAQYIKESFSQPQNLPSVSARFKGYDFKIMLAKKRDEKAKGLMFYNEIASNTGMLFIYKYPQKMSFWMMNTKIPLDLVFFSENMEVTEYIKNMIPGYGKKIDLLPHYTSKGEAKYALELKAGMIDELSIKVGDKLEIPQIFLELPNEIQYSDY